MKTGAVALLTVACALAFGCEHKPAVKMEEGKGVEVNAPGIHVNAGGGKGVEVEAPGVEVQTAPAK
jgi:hypothetical protein